MAAQEPCEQSISKQGLQAASFTYGYDPNSNRATITYPGGVSATYAHDLRPARLVRFPICSRARAPDRLIKMCASVAEMSWFFAAQIGPAFVKLGRDVRYRPSDLLRFVDLRVCRDTWQGKIRRLPDEA